ncbi:MAG: ribonuclease P protein component [Cucumibacter sp.]
MRRLTKRAQFLKAARGAKALRRGFVLQAASSLDDEPGLGFTVSRRAGNAVERNRIRRRLRAAAGMNAVHFTAGHDYVLIGRRDALHEPFDRLVGGLAAALGEIGKKRAEGDNRGRE